MFRLLRERKAERKWKERVSTDINEVGDYFDSCMKEFYCAFGRLVNDETGKQIERDIFEASRGIHLYLTLKNSLLTLLGTNEYPIEKSRFDDLMMDFEKAAEIVSDSHCSCCLRERKTSLLSSIKPCYS